MFGSLTLSFSHDDSSEQTTSVRLQSISWRDNIFISGLFNDAISKSQLIYQRIGKDVERNGRGLI